MILADLNATDLAAVVVAVTSLFAMVLLVVVAAVVVRTMRTLQAVAEQFEARTTPVLDELRETVGHAADELDRADSLLDVTESISTSVDQASRVAYLAMSNPVIKTMAFASGAGRAARRLKNGAES